jgi:hypothetical protein
MKIAVPLIAAWLRFVDTITRRYGKEVKHWEIWNEPNTVWFWKPSPIAAEHVELVRRTTPLIKRNIPSARVLGGSVARLDLPLVDYPILIAEKAAMGPALR